MILTCEIASKHWCPSSFLLRRFSGQSRSPPLHHPHPHLLGRALWASGAAAAELAIRMLILNRCGPGSFLNEMAGLWSPLVVTGHGPFYHSPLSDRVSKQSKPKTHSHPRSHRGEFSARGTSGENPDRICRSIQSNFQAQTLHFRR